MTGRFVHRVRDVSSKAWLTTLRQLPPFRYLYPHPKISIIGSSVRIDIVLPCFNPASGWVDNVIAHTARLIEHFPDAELGCTIVNDGSRGGVSDSDAARLKAELPALNWISYPENRGKGYALRTGVRQSSADVIMYTDIDFPYSTESMEKCLNAILNDDADIALAIRNRSYYTQLPPLRRFISRTLRMANRMFLGMRTSDTQGGLKVFNHRGKEIFLQTTIDRYLFDLEFIYLASKQKDLRIQAIEAELREGVQFTSVKAGILLGEGWNFLRLLVKK